MNLSEQIKNKKAMLPFKKIERIYLTKLISICETMEDASKMAGMPVRTLYRWASKYKIEKVSPEEIDVLCNEIYRDNSGDDTPSMPEQCETCKWFHSQSHMADCKEYDGSCQRFPSWESVDNTHKCGEWQDAQAN